MNKLIKNRGLLLSLGSLAVFSSCAQQQPQEAKKPNIVFIFADDMGYGDVSALNENSKIKRQISTGLPMKELFLQMHIPVRLSAHLRVMAC